MFKTTVAKKMHIGVNFILFSFIISINVSDFKRNKLVGLYEDFAIESINRL